MQSSVRYFGKGFLGMFFLGLIFIFSGRAHANQWAQTYGGAGTDEARVTQQTTDGGYIVGGIISSFGAGGNDAYVSKLDASGNIIWQKTYGGAGDDGVASIQQTTDGGYIVGAWTTSAGAGQNDFWVLKLDASGNVTWQKTYGGGNNDLGATVIQQTADGGYIMVGPTQSFGQGNTDVWVLKLDASGNVTWQKSYGAGQLDYAYSIQQTADLGYIVAGRTTSSGNGLNDVWVLKLDATGAVTWQKTYGGAGDDVASNIQQTADLGYIVTGYTNSSGAGGNDAWILKLDATGNVTWQNTYGGAGADVAWFIKQTGDGGYIAAGWADSFGAGLLDVWVLKLDGSGNVTWQKTYGGASNDRATSIQLTSDGGYIMSGYTASFGAGGNDAWVLKLDASGNIPNCGPQGTSTATVTVTSVTPINTTVAAPDSAAGSPDTNATITNTAMTQILACFFADPVAPTSIPTLSEWGVILLAGLLGLFGVGVVRRRSRLGKQPTAV